MCLPLSGTLLHELCQASWAPSLTQFMAMPSTSTDHHVCAHTNASRSCWKKGLIHRISCCGNDAAEAEASFQLSTEGIIDYKD